MAPLLITKHFVFIHFKKTGGTFFRRLFLNHLPEDWIVERRPLHTGWNKIPEEYTHLPAIAFIRNPWDWYVSWYHWETQYLGSGDRPTPERDTHPWSTLLGRGSYDFREAVTRACTRREGRRPWEVAMRAWDVDMLTASFAVFTGRYPGPLPPDIAHKQPSDGRLPVDVGRFEHLREDLLGFMDRHEIPVTKDFIEAVKSSPPQHASRRGQYAGYYDEELRDLVAGKARHLIEAHGYEF